LFSLLAIISGANSYRSITRFMHVRLEWFKSLTGIDWPTAPSHTGLRKCFLKLDGNAIEYAYASTPPTALTPPADHAFLQNTPSNSDAVYPLHPEQSERFLDTVAAKILMPASMRLCAQFPRTT
jgi:hypothetical protein